MIIQRHVPIGSICDKIDIASPTQTGHLDMTQPTSPLFVQPGQSPPHVADRRVRVHTSTTTRTTPNGRRMTMTTSPQHSQHHEPPGITPVDHSVRDYAIKDGIRDVTFRGVQLSHVSSERPESPRWTEITIYRTEGGHFVVHRVGVSLVIHSIDCDSIAGKRLPGPDAIKPDEVPVEDRVPCTICDPDIDMALDTDPLSLRVEIDRHWTAVCDNAPGITDVLHTNKHGTRSLSFLAAAAIRDAADHDAAIAAAYQTVDIA